MAFYCESLLKVSVCFFRSVSDAAGATSTAVSPGITPFTEVFPGLTGLGEEYTVPSSRFNALLVRSLPRNKTNNRGGDRELQPGGKWHPPPASRTRTGPEQDPGKSRTKARTGLNQVPGKTDNQARNGTRPVSNLGKLVTTAALI